MREGEGDSIFGWESCEITAILWRAGRGGDLIFLKIASIIAQ